jgi:cell division control protein 6
MQSLVSIFSLPQSHPSRLRVIGIANVHTLTSSNSQLSLHGVTGVNTLHFTPYTPAQLLDILQARLGRLCDADTGCITRDQLKEFLPPATLTLLTKKVAPISGDVRTLFEVLRGAIDLAVESGSKKGSALPIVTPPHILSALKAHKPATAKQPCSFTLPGDSPTCSAVNSSEVVTTVKNLGFQAQLALLSLLLATKRLELGLAISSPQSPSKSPVKRTSSAKNVGTPEGTTVDSTQLHTYYSAILSRLDNDVIDPVSRSEFADLMGMLETVGLVTLSSTCMSAPSSPSKSGRRTMSFGGGNVKGKDRGQEVRIVEGIRCNEVLRGMGVNEIKEKATSIREEEVLMIWEREKGKMLKDLKSRNSGQASMDVFVGAIED